MQGRTLCLVALGTMAVVGMALSGGLYLRLRALEHALEERTVVAKDVEKPACGTSPARTETHHAVAQTPPTPVKNNAEKPPEPSVLAIKTVDYPGDDVIKIHLTARPDMSVLREYVTVTPMKGTLTLSVEGYNAETCVSVRGDYAIGKPLTLRLRGGCPAAQKGVAPLSADVVRHFTRKDLVPYVRFATSGRYLPPGGARMLALESVNVTNILCAAAAIPRENIVQMLAREENRYQRYWGYGSADCECTEELADAFTTWTVPVDREPNSPVITSLALRKLPDAASNGVFLVVARSADRAREDEVWWWRDPRGETRNPNRYRLVCMTDIGLTVRSDARQMVVWTTSLTTGQPCAGCQVDVYGSNNRRLMQGTTDATGLCVLPRSGKGEPFVVVAQTAGAADTSFVCLAEKHARAEQDCTYPEPRKAFLKPAELTAFVWTERDIYRHGEKMFMKALVRNGRHVAPPQTPLALRLIDPTGRTFVEKTFMTDAQGALSQADWSVPPEAASGRWRFEVAVPGKNGVVLGAHTVSVEEFAPPQIRVKLAGLTNTASNYAFEVKAEHLHGGPAAGLLAEGAVLFKDEPFAPRGWSGWRFGNDDLGLEPNFQRLDKQVLDASGRAVFTASMPASVGRPRAAVCVTGEGTVFEAGGRPARARVRQTLHLAPFYIGTTLGENVRIPERGFARIKVACVKPDGTCLAGVRRIRIALARIDCVYGNQEDSRGWTTWHCDRVRVPVKLSQTEFTTGPQGTADLEIPTRLDGDYVLTLTDEGEGASFGTTFWLGSCGDDAVRAPLANPAAITLTPDRPLYRPGDVPRLLVKAPFAGWALLSVMHEKIVTTRAFHLARPSCEVTLDPVAADWAPNVDVSLSVVQSAENDGYRQTARAHGYVTLPVRVPAHELPVTVKASFTPGDSGCGSLAVQVTARGTAATGTVATVTVVDEGIHLLTDYKTPDPVAHFARLRAGSHPLVDLFDNLLPVWDGDPAKVRGVKTGGGGEGDLLGRVSPEPSRRFKPLALWQGTLPLVGGIAETTFALPRFAGEVRVTAVAYSAQAEGAGDVAVKVTPRLIVTPDAPRFAAPGDVFQATLTLENRAGTNGLVTGTAPDGSSWRVSLDAGRATNMIFRVRAQAVPGHQELLFAAAGFGENHRECIALPVRSPVPARETAGTWELAPGAARVLALSPDCAFPAAAVRQVIPYANLQAQLVSALEFLAEYPHGCLEQTTARIFPLVNAGGWLNTLAANDPAHGTLSDRAAYVKAGVARVVSMIRDRDFTMWPDCDGTPTREVSLFAAHFLMACHEAGTPVPQSARSQVLQFLHRWAYDESNAASAYACMILALADAAVRDRMLVLYDRCAKLEPLDRMRLAWAFARIGDQTRAQRLLAGCTQPADVKEAAFAVLAILACDAQDARLAGLVRYLEDARDRQRFHWGTTAMNAHALLALGAYYRHHPGISGTPQVTCTREKEVARNLPLKKRETVRGGGDVTLSNRGTGSAWVVWRILECPDPASVTNAAHVIRLARSYLTPEGAPLDLKKLRCGDLVIVDLTLTSDCTRNYSDLVIQDLFPAACEPVRGGYDGLATSLEGKSARNWVLRSDARDDRMLVFSKAFGLKAGEVVRFRYPLRVVTAGEFRVPSASVEAMYAPEIRATVAPGWMTVTR